MKKFTKLFLSCAAVAALTAAVATSAMAAEGVSFKSNDGLTADYDATTGKVTVTTSVTPDAGEQATLLVYSGTEKVAVDGSNVVGIDQAADAGFTNTGLKGQPPIPAADADVETFTVMVGYKKGGIFVTETGVLTLGTEKGVEIQLGNVDGNSVLGTNGVGAQDAAYILRYSTNGTGAKGDAGVKITLVEEASANGITIPAGTTIALGDVDGNHILGTDGVSAQDAAYILRYATNNDAAKGLAGVTVKATKVETEE